MFGLPDEESLNTFIVRAFGKDLEHLSYRRVTNKCDGKTSIVLVKANAVRFACIEAVTISIICGEQILYKAAGSKGKENDVELWMHLGCHVGRHDRHGSVI